MRKQKIYLDTSVIGGCFDAEFAQWSNALMDDFREGYFTPVVSTIVAAEIALAPAFVRERYAEILALGAEVLEESEASDGLAGEYREHAIVPERFYADALHIALATVAQVDLLASWNFKHIVRFDRIRLFNAVNREMGYKEIEIYSPREVARDGEY
ncbi:MAG TPA: PIN domain-containing protein [Longimicrobiaceae bacterium]|nr:PIN domain-containing protein [Longimicrobiaceae bacterium]